MKASPQGLISAVVVAFNGGDALVECLQSLANQSAKVEIIVVDNASSDGSIDRVATLNSRIRIIRCGANGGYAMAANAGWRVATSEYVAILNQDLLLHADCLARMRDTLMSAPNDLLVTPKLVLRRDPTRVNAVGNEVHRSGIAWCNGLGSLAESWTGVEEVSAISGAAFMGSRTLLERLGGLEERYFMYMEDVDLSLRARLLGASCVTACDAVAVHDWRLALEPAKFRLLERNRRALWIRFWGGRPELLPFFAQAELMGWAYALLRGRPFLLAKAAASRDELSLTRWPATALDGTLARFHPYSLLFPGNQVIASVGRLADGYISTLATLARALARTAGLADSHTHK